MNTLNITDIKVMPLKDGNYDCVAIAQFTVDNALAITGLKLYKKVNDKGVKYYVVFPKNVKNKKQMKYAHPLTDEVYQVILDKIVREYDRMEAADNAYEMGNDNSAENEYYKKTFGTTLNEDVENIIKCNEENEKTENTTILFKRKYNAEEIKEQTFEEIEAEFNKTYMDLLVKTAKNDGIELPKDYDKYDAYHLAKWMRLKKKHPNDEIDIQNVFILNMNTLSVVKVDEPKEEVINTDKMEEINNEEEKV